MIPDTIIDRLSAVPEDKQQEQGINISIVPVIKTRAKLARVHPEMALFGNLCVNLSRFSGMRRTGVRGGASL